MNSLSASSRPLLGGQRRVALPVSEGIYVISWQEADGATVVHVDDFVNERSMAFFTASNLTFHHMQGQLSELDATHMDA